MEINNNRLLKSQEMFRVKKSIPYSIRAEKMKNQTSFILNKSLKGTKDYNSQLRKSVAKQQNIYFISANREAKMTKKNQELLKLCEEQPFVYQSNPNTNFLQERYTEQRRMENMPNFQNDSEYKKRGAMPAGKPH